MEPASGKVLLISPSVLWRPRSKSASLRPFSPAYALRACPQTNHCDPHRHQHLPLQAPARRMGGDLNPAYISALAALAGAIIGGLTSFTTSWLTQRTQL